MGTTNPILCPPGTFGATEGLRNVSECTPCNPGKYCAQYGLLTNEGLYIFNENLNENLYLKTSVQERCTGIRD